MVNTEYSKAYKEVLEILKFIPKEDFDKIPTTQIDFLEKNADKKHDFIYTPLKTLNEQNVSNLAKCIIIILFKEYWANETQKLKILKKEKYDKEFLEFQKRKLYNPNNIFKNRKNVEEYKDIHNVQKGLELIEYKKQKWYQIIFQKIFKIFRDK